MTSDEWFAGANAPLQLLSMETVFHHGLGGQPSRKRDFTPKESDAKPPSQPEPVPKKAAPHVEAMPKKAPETVSPTKSSTFPTDKSQTASVKEQPPMQEPIKEQAITRTQSQPEPKAVEPVAAKVIYFLLLMSNLF